ncbi:low affinity iron permease family protein [Sphingobium yanoikuyae]|uniref:low affinity iron permease family protein n=1 Tax=Sphingobium yanoikuyae TaxID=13690 RepID=UPI003AF9A21E
MSRCSHYVCQIVVWRTNLEVTPTWQLIVNTATTVLTFLAVFLIQNSQNRDGAAMQAKLDEIIRALDKARVEFVGIEHLTDAQIAKIREALENDIRNEADDDKDRTVTRTVETLLKRY